MVTNIFKKKNGFTLIEMILYISFLAVMCVLVVNTLFVMIRSHRNIKVSQNIQYSAIASLDRMVREIRDASSLDVVSSILGVDPGILSLKTSDVNGLDRTVEFYRDASSEALIIKENNEVVGPLNLSHVRVTGLLFELVEQSGAKAIKINLSLESGAGELLKSETFYSTILLRDR